MKIAAIFLKAVVVLIALGALALLLWEPQLEGRNAHATNFQIYFQDPFLALVYAGSIPFFAGCWQAFRLLGFAGQGRTFSTETVKALRAIKHCALAVIGFVVVEEIFIMLTHGDDDAAGGVFMGVLIIFGSLIVVAMAELLGKVLQDAMDPRSGTA